MIPFLFLLSLFFPGGQLYAYEAVVTHVLDGDSFRVRQGRQIQTIRLYGIDCPEYRQHGWRQAKQFTKRVLARQRLTIHPMDVDRYGRTVALVYVDGRLLNADLVSYGWAWLYRRYCHAQPLCREFNQLEQNARAGKKGIWQKKKPMPPWVWKRKKYK
jgi:endonuclease YncB( thermonuclease family)